MKILAELLDPRPFWKEGYAKPTTLLLAASVLPTLHFYVGSIAFAQNSLHMERSAAVLYMFAAAALFFGLIPIAIVKVFKETLVEHGLCLGDWRSGLKFSAWAFPIILVAFLLPGAYTPELREFYPFDKAAGESFGAFVNLELSRLVLFYSAWEILFRGVLLFGLRKYVGDWFAILIQVIPSCLWHLGMPSSEIFSSIAAGVGFGMLALRTRSMLWPLLVHFLIGTGTDALIILLN